MWKSHRVLARFKTSFQFMCVMALSTFSGYSIAVESTSTCWVYGGLSGGQNTQMIYGLNELDGQSWPDPASAFRAFEQFTASRLIGVVGCMRPYQPYTTITQIEVGPLRISHTSSGPVGDPRTGIPIGYSQSFIALNQTGEYCSVGAVFEATDGSYWNYPQCRKNYTVKLSLLSGQPESETILSSIEPDKSTGSLVAKVYDHNGQLVPNAKVKLELSVDADSGGHHQHTSERPRGSLKSGTMTGVTVTGSTGTSGFTFTFKAPAPAGDHKIMASCTDGKNCKPEGADLVWVGVKGLEPIIPASDTTSGPLYVLIGQDSYHPNNHYLTPLAIGRLQQLAAIYRQRFPSDPPLHLNDASLERGGMFDINFAPYTDKKGVYHSRTPGGVPGSWWVAPHDEHRRGTVIDVRANDAEGSIPVDPQHFEAFEKMAKDQGAHARIHSPGTSNQHYHIRLMGVAE